MKDDTRLKLYEAKQTWGKRLNKVAIGLAIMVGAGVVWAFATNSDSPSDSVDESYLTDKNGFDRDFDAYIKNDWEGYSYVGGNDQYEVMLGVISNKAIEEANAGDQNNRLAITAITNNKDMQIKESPRTVLKAAGYTTNKKLLAAVAKKADYDSYSDVLSQLQNTQGSDLPHGIYGWRETKDGGHVVTDEARTELLHKAFQDVITEAYTKYVEKHYLPGAKAKAESESADAAAKSSSEEAAQAAEAASQQASSAAAESSRVAESESMDAHVSSISASVSASLDADIHPSSRNTTANSSVGSNTAMFDGGTLYQFATAHNTSTANIIALNPGLTENDYTLWYGKELKIK